MGGFEAEGGFVRGRGEGHVHAGRDEGGAIFIRRIAVRGGVAVGVLGLLRLLYVPVAGTAEVTEELDNAGQRLSAGEVLTLESVELFGVFFEAYGELGPVGKESVGGRTRAALELGFDGPGEFRALVLLEDEVHTDGVDILRVQEKPVQVEKTGSDGREATGLGYQRLK